MEPVAKLAVAGILVASLGAYLAAERRDREPVRERADPQIGRNPRAWMWVAKPLASACFVLLALPLQDPWLFAALLLSFAGDLLLIPREPRVFRAGIVVFLLAHLAFVAAFAARGIAWGSVAIALVPLALAAWTVTRWILPTVPRGMRPAVLAYVVVITGMVAAAAGAVAGGASPFLLAAALGFYANDILVARDRFVTKAWVNRLVGLPLYYGAMALFALEAAVA